MENRNTVSSYYYMDGLDKKGPYTIEELLFRSLSPNTLVFSDGMTSWVPIKEIPELSSKIFEKLDPVIQELPEVKSTTILTAHEENLEESTPVKKLSIPSMLFLLVGIVIVTCLSYYIVQNQKDEDLKVIQFNIKNVLNDKDEVCDYQHEGVQGQLQEANSMTPVDNEGKRLIQYYKCANGGFTVRTLTKKDNGYEIVISTSEDMGYKIPASHYTAGTNYGYGIATSGYLTSNYRQSIQTAYDEAMKYLSSEKENKSYNPGSYDKIKSFSEIESTFYDIENIDPTKISAGATNFKNWKGNGLAYVFNSQWVVFYTTEGSHYEIVEKKNAFIVRFLIYSIIGSILAILLYLLIKNRRKIEIS